jgi:multiple sugar transport system substrate-binding protein
MQGKVSSMRRIWLRINALVPLLALLLLSACGGNSPSNSTNNGQDPSVLSSSKQYTVDFWEVFGTGANKTALEGLTKQYMQKHPNVKVNLQAYDSYTTLQTKLNAAIAGKQPPAIAQVYESGASKYQQTGQIVSLQPYIAGQNGLSESEIGDFYPSLLNTGKIDGTQYTLPFNKSNEALYYNADILKQLNLKPPTTLNEFVDVLTKVTKSGQRWGLSITPSVDEWAILYKALGGKAFTSQDGKDTGFDKGNDKTYAKQALDLLAPLVKSGAVHVTQGYSWQNDFIAQKSVFALSTIASYPFLDAGIKNAFKFDEAAIPAGPAGSYTVLFGTNLALFKGVSDDNRTAAWDYLKFLTGKEANTSFVKQTGYMPVRKSVFNSSELQAYYNQVPARKVGPEMIDNAFVPSILPGWQSCRDNVTNEFTGVLKGQSSSDDALTKMAQQCAEVLSA